MEEFTLLTDQSFFHDSELNTREGGQFKFRGYAMLIDS